MKKLIPWLAGLSVCVLTFFLLANAHVIIFPGVEYSQNLDTHKLEATDTAISLMAHMDGYNEYGYSELKPIGYVLVAIVCLLPGILISFLLRRAFR